MVFSVEIKCPIGVETVLKMTSTVLVLVKSFYVYFSFRQRVVAPTLMNLAVFVFREHSKKMFNNRSHDAFLVTIAKVSRGALMPS